MHSKAAHIWYKFLQNEQLNCENLYYGENIKLSETYQLQQDLLRDNAK